MTHKFLRIAVVMAAVIGGSELCNGDSPEDSKSPWGVVADWPYHYGSEPEKWHGSYTPDLDSMKVCGLRWNRPNLAPRTVEEDKHNFTPGHFPLDSLVEYMQDRDLYLSLLMWPPTWWPWAHDPSKWEHYWTVMVQRYDGDGDASDMPGLVTPIKYWNICNEPGYQYGSGLRSPFEGTMERYREYMITSAQAIHAANPDVKVVAPSCSPSRCRWLDAGGIHYMDMDEYWGAIFDDGGLDCIDVLAIHYPAENFWDVQQLHNILATYGAGDKEVWSTETGAWRTGQMTEEEQKDHYMNFCRNWFQNRDLLDRVFFFCFIDGDRDGHDRPDEDAGMLWNDLSHKLAFDSLQEFIYFTSEQNDPTAYQNQRKLVSDGIGRLHLVTSGYGDIRYTMSQDGGQSWMNMRLVAESSPGSLPAVATEWGDIIHVCWVSDDGLWYTRKTTWAGWDEPHLLVAKGDKCFSPPSIAVHGNTVHLTFEYGWYSADKNWHHRLYHYEFTDPQDITALEIDAFQATEFVPAYPSIALTRGQPHVCWERQGNIVYRYYSGENWKDEMQLFTGERPCIEIWEDPRTSHRSVHIVWQQESYSSLLHVRGCIRTEVFGLMGLPVTSDDEVILGHIKPVSEDVVNPPEHAQITGGSQIVWSGHADGKLYHSRYDGSNWHTIGPFTDGEDRFPQVTIWESPSEAFWMPCVYTEGDGPPYQIASDTRLVTLTSLCSPIVTSGREGESMRSVWPTLGWEDVNADSYVVEYSLDPSFTDPQEPAGLTVPYYTIEDDTLHDDCMIWWRVTAFKDTTQRMSEVDSFFWDLPTTYWVDDANGNDSWVASKSQPWKTIQKAASELQPYERVFVRVGNYREQVVPANSGTSSDRIYYVAYPGETVVLDGDGQLYGLNIHGKSYLTFDGFDLVDYATASVKISQASGTPASHNVIKNCSIASPSVNSLQGIHIWGSSEALCRDNVIENTSVILNNEAFYNVKLEYAPNTQLLNDTLRYATYGVRITGSDSVRVANCIISDMESYGIYGYSNVLAPQILNSTLHKTGTYAGVFLQESRNAEIIGNSVDSSGTGSTGAAIWCDTRCDHAVIQGNNITLGEGQATIGIKTRTDCDSTTISGNTFTRSGGWSSEAAIYLGQSCNHVDIHANIVEDASLSGIVVGGVSGGCSGVRLWNNNVASKNIGISIPKKTQSNIRVWNNVIRAACGIRNFGAEESWFGFCTVHADTAIYLDDFTGTADYDTLRNNILYGEDYCVYMKMMFFGPSGFSSDYNDLFTETGHVGSWKGSNKTTLGAWQSASGGDANSISSDPLFVSEADLHITESSPCVDAGTAILWITTDYEGQERSDPPDIGGDEWYAETGGGTMGGSGDSPFIFKLAQNYPNPFRQGTTIRYSIPKMAKVTLRVYDVTGRMVKQLVNKEQKPGVYTAHWQGNTPNSRRLATGVYFVRLTADAKIATRKLVMVR
jgi:hypothetical protein